MAKKKDDQAVTGAANTSEDIAKKDAERREKAAEAATAKAKHEGRLPESMAVTNPAPAGAEDMDSSGAFTEPEIKKSVPVDHPAVDNNPRQGTSAVQSGADFNDPYRRTPADEKFVGQGLDPVPYGKAAKK